LHTLRTLCRAFPSPIIVLVNNTGQGNTVVINVVVGVIVIVIFVVTVIIVLVRVRLILEQFPQLCMIGGRETGRTTGRYKFSQPCMIEGRETGRYASG
jgi:hypothetical protein